MIHIVDPASAPPPASFNLRDTQRSVGDQKFAHVEGL